MPAGTPLIGGEIPQDGIVSLLQEIEASRATGVLVFESGATRGEVTLVAGQISTDQMELPDGRDPVELLLGLREGRFEVWPRLPPLPVSQGDAVHRSGSLTVHVPADLMRYCERAALTGRLVLTHEAEQATALYVEGDLREIRLEGGTENDDVNRAFGWDAGTFRIEIDPEVAADAGAPAQDAAKEPARQPQAPRPSDGAFLRVVEVALSEIIDERENRRPASRSSPGVEDLLVSPSRHASLPPGKPDTSRRREPTVRIVLLGSKPAKPAGDSAATRHVRTDVTAEVMLADAHPDRAGSSAEGEAHERAPRAREEEHRLDDGDGPGGKGSGRSDPKGPPSSPSPRKDSVASTLGWALFLVLLAMAAVELLSRVPPLH